MSRLIFKMLLTFAVTMETAPRPRLLLEGNRGKTERRGEVEREGRTRARRCRCGFNGAARPAFPQSAQRSVPHIMGRYNGQTCRLIFMLVITVIFFVAEIVAGYLGNSIALVSDSFNMLSDTLSLCVGLAAGRLARRPATPGCTFGLARAEVVGALANAAFLAALCFSVSAEAVKRLAQPEAVAEPFTVLIVGSLGLAVNVVGLLVFQDWRWLCGKKEEARRDEPSDSDGKRVMNGEAGAPICASVSIMLHSRLGIIKSVARGCV